MLYPMQLMITYGYLQWWLDANKFGDNPECL